MESLRRSWHNAYYKATITYIALMVTTILSLQLYRFFISAPASELKCPNKDSFGTLSSILVTGALVNE